MVGLSVGVWAAIDASVVDNKLAPEPQTHGAKGDEVGQQARGSRCELGGQLSEQVGDGGERLGLQATPQQQVVRAQCRVCRSAAAQMTPLTSLHDREGRCIILVVCVALTFCALGSIRLAYSSTVPEMPCSCLSMLAKVAVPPQL